MGIGMDKKQERKYGKLIAMANIIRLESSAFAFSTITISDLRQWFCCSRTDIDNILEIRSEIDTEDIIEKIYVNHKQDIIAMEEESRMIGMTMGYVESIMRTIFRWNLDSEIKSIMGYDLISRVPDHYNKELYRFFLSQGIRRKIEVIDWAVEKTKYPVDVILEMDQLPAADFELYASFKREVTQVIDAYK